MPDMDLVALKEDLIQKHEYITDKDVLSAALYPKVFDDYREFRKVYGPVDKLDTRVFLHGPDIAEEINVRDLRLIYLGYIYSGHCPEEPAIQASFVMGYNFGAHKYSILSID